MLAGSLTLLSVSATVYRTGVGLPVKPCAGVKVTAPLCGSTVQVPSFATTRLVTGLPVGSSSLTLLGSMLFCGSLSLASTSITTACPVVPCAWSSVAFGLTTDGGGGVVPGSCGGGGGGVRPGPGGGGGVRPSPGGGGGVRPGPGGGGAIVS